MGGVGARVRILDGTKIQTTPDLTVDDVQKVCSKSIEKTMLNPRTCWSEYSTCKCLRPTDRTPRLWVQFPMGEACHKSPKANKMYYFRAWISPDSACSYRRNVGGELLALRCRPELVESTWPETDVFISSLDKDDCVNYRKARSFLLFFVQERPCDRKHVF